jgi:predicted CXXCH cytochrome family protein
LSLNGLWLVGGVAVFGLIISGGGAFTIHMEGNDAFCASCHTQPETTYVERAQSQLVDLASAHAVENVACIECHSGAGLTGRAGAILEGANNAARFTVGQYNSPAIANRPLADANCLKCHAEAVATNEPARHFHYYLSRWQVAAPDAGGCTSCHQAHVTGGKVETDFLQQTSTQIVCAQCHAAAMAELP